MDDFLLFSNDKRNLAHAREQISNFLTSLRLRLHTRKNSIFPVADGIRFLGYRVSALCGRLHACHARIRRPSQDALRSVRVQSSGRRPVSGWVCPVRPNHNRPGRSSRPQGSNVLPGSFVHGSSSSIKPVAEIARLFSLAECFSSTYDGALGNLH